MATQLNFRESGTEDEDYRAVFADVILPLALPNAYTYRVPVAFHSSVGVGQRVVVQFGKKKIYTALVTAVHSQPPRDYTAKYILDLLDDSPIIQPRQLLFWKWVADYYCCTIGEVMDAALPGNMKMESETRVVLSQGAEPYRDLSEKEKLVIAALQDKKILSIREISDLLEQKTVLPLVKSLYEKGMLSLREEMTDVYKPRIELFVSFAIDVTDPAVRERLFKELESAPRQSDILMAFLHLQGTVKPVMRRLLLKTANAPGSALEALVAKGILTIFEEEVDRIKDSAASGWEYKLNTGQKEALDETKVWFRDHDVVLLHGVTGSGKTHVFMELIDEVIEENRQALYLVPEISLTTQLVNRLRNKYGKDIGIYHSRFSSDERVEIWHKVLSGQYKVVLGVRSALFLPFPDLGLIIIDEEHEHSFKQYEPAPRYHARDAGIYLASLSGAKTLLGTATPSFESFFNASRGKYGLVKLMSRYGEMVMPEMIFADLREETRKKTMKSHFSSVLYDEMKTTLRAGGQVILFQNRRGYAPILECTTCGWTPICRNCDISLTYHQSAREVICHYCGYHEPVPKKCHACGSYTLKMLGFGTEKIEDELQIFFPEYKTIRMDQDTTRGRQAYNKIIGAFEDGEAQILVGTQMVTKGLDFENVRLVGILNADQMLRYPDFRAVEHSYHLMSQVSGRAGRRGIKGKVVVQTWNLQHPMFQYLLTHDYDGFYESEIQERVDFKYPPFYKLIKISVRHESREQVSKSSEKLAEGLREVFGHRVLGPEFPPIARIRGRYTMNILLKFERQNLSMAEAKVHLMKEAENFRTSKENKGVRLIIDVDPY